MRIFYDNSFRMSSLTMPMTTVVLFYKCCGKCVWPVLWTFCARPEFRPFPRQLRPFRGPRDPWFFTQHVPVHEFARRKPEGNSHPLWKPFRAPFGFATRSSASSGAHTLPSTCGAPVRAVLLSLFRARNVSASSKPIPRAVPAKKAVKINWLLPEKRFRRC